MPTGQLKILVLHNNFPAQFKFLLPDLVSRGHEVIFLSLESHGNKISGVKHYKISSKVDSSTSSWKSPYKGLGKKVDVSEIFRAAFVSLKEDGFYPDISVFHSGWGIGYYLKSVFPSTKSFAYAEWWFNWDSEENQFDPESPYSPSGSVKEKVSHQLLNSFQSVEISESDFVWTPTQWQKSQFPHSIQSRMSVVHEGVDTSFYRPFKKRDFNKLDLKLTYSSRALESMRCFDHFIPIISRVLKANPRLSLSIVGKEKAVYRPLRSNHKSLLSVAKNIFTTNNVLERVQFFTRLNPLDYRKMFMQSDLHIYYSRPFVASWSLLESMSSGCTLVSNPTPMTNEFLAPCGVRSGALLHDCLDHDNAAEEIISLLENRKRMKNISEEMRSRALDYDFRTQLKQLRSYISY